MPRRSADSATNGLNVEPGGYAVRPEPMARFSSGYPLAWLLRRSHSFVEKPSMATRGS